MIQVSNTNDQLNIINDSNGLISDVYSFDSIKSISKGLDASGNYYISINFIANDKNNSLRIYLIEVASPSWPNDSNGAETALQDISSWMRLSLNDASAVSPHLLSQTGIANSLSRDVTSISFASIGTANALVSFNSGTTYVPLEPGITINMDAGDNNDYYREDTFYWDTTTAGARLLITYNSRPL